MDRPHLAKTNSASLSLRPPWNPLCPWSQVSVTPRVSIFVSRFELTACLCTLPGL